jgi:hypothetical protein
LLEPARFVRIFASFGDMTDAQPLIQKQVKKISYFLFFGAAGCADARNPW